MNLLSQMYLNLMLANFHVDLHETVRRDGHTDKLSCRKGDVNEEWVVNEGRCNYRAKKPEQNQGNLYSSLSHFLSVSKPQWQS